jgi:hypothetical protein
VDFYLGADAALELEKVDLASEGNRTRVRLKANVVPGQPLEADALPSLVVYTDGDGKRHGINVAVPVGVLKKKATATTTTPTKD